MTDVMANQDHGFVVSLTDVDLARRLLDSAVMVSDSVSLTLRPGEWPAFAAALGVAVFYTVRSRGGNGFLYAHKSIATDHGDVMVWVNCWNLPADWIAYPEGEATNRYKFNVRTLP
jgi:hypothetical protein